MAIVKHFDGNDIEVGDTVSGDIRSITGEIPNSGASFQKIDFTEIGPSEPALKTSGVPGIQGLKSTLQEPIGSETEEK